MLLRFLPSRSEVLLCVLSLTVALAAAGCGLFSSSSESLPGVYESEEFRVQRAGGEVDDVGDAGAEFGMTLAEDGEVRAGRLLIPPASPGGPETLVSFTGTYERDGDRVTFDFDEDALSQDHFRTGTPLADVDWIFYEKDGALRTDADAYVLFLQKEGEVDGE